MRSCGFCNKEFETIVHNGKYCSDKCRLNVKLKQHSLWVLNNKNKLRQYDECFYESNKAQRIERDKLYRRHKMATDPIYKLRANLRKRLNKAISINSRKGKALDNLGCSVAELKDYLSSKFIENMSWDNYGRKKGIKCWEIDHVKPLSSFDLTNLEQLKAACHYTNLQPLWAVDNHQKHNSDSNDFVIENKH